MKNSTTLKNELIFQYAAGSAGLSKSLMASTYLYLNSNESELKSKFEEYCGEEFKNVKQVKTENLNFKNCISPKKNDSDEFNYNKFSPINKFVGSLANIKWKKVFNGFYEYSLGLSKKENSKLIKMDPGTKIPFHSHNGREYILVLEGSFQDEYGKYSKGNLQINDSNIKHTPIACKNEGCICLTITEQELVFYGPFAPLLNLVTLIKSVLSSNK